MQLVNMKMSPKEAKAETGLISSDDAELPEYPWGLSLSLCDDSLTKLGMAEMPAIGTRMQLTAMVTVVSTRAAETQAGGTDKDVGLQITDMALGADAAPRGAADVLYGKQG